MAEEEWAALEGGATVGTVGSESGIIVRDDEHPLGARITLERGSRNAPFALTCGIYGTMVHTTYAGSDSEAATRFDAMRERLSLLLAVPDDDRDGFYAELARFVSDFP